MKYRTAGVVWAAVALVVVMAAAPAWAQATASSEQSTTAIETPGAKSQPNPGASDASAGAIQNPGAAAQQTPGPGSAAPAVPAQPVVSYFYSQPTPPPTPRYSGRWAWDPIGQFWYWQVIVLPPPLFWTPYPYTYWYINPWLPGQWRFITGPDWRNRWADFITPKPLDMPFKPGEGPQFPWLPRDQGGDKDKNDSQQHKGTTQQAPQSR